MILVSLTGYAIRLKVGAEVLNTYRTSHQRPPPRTSEEPSHASYTRTRETSVSTPANIMSRSRNIRFYPPRSRDDDEDEYGTDSAEAGGVRYDTASQKESRRSRRRKLSMLRILAMLLIVAVVVSFSVKAKVLSWFPQTSFHSTTQSSLACARRTSFSMQSDHRPHSYGGELYLQAARASFQVPIGSQEFSIDALGTRGSIRFTLYNQTEAHEDKDLILGHHIKVDVAAFSDDWLEFERAARICQTTPHLTETGYTSEGFLISADTSRLSHDRTAFDIVVRFPASTWASQPLRLSNISASLYDFNILVDNMDGFVTFDSVFMRTMSKPICISSMHANNVRLQNWNGEIAGSLTSSNHINLYAHNGAVSLNATLLAGGYYHDGDSNIQTPTLIVTSVNGAIDADVSLLSQSQVATTNVPAYKTIFHTNKAPLTVTYPTAPEHHNLTLFTSNSHAPTTLRLPESFVGGLALRSPSPYRRPVVHFDEGADKRGRTLQITSLDDNVITASVVSRDVVHELHGGLVDAQAIDGGLDLLL